MAVRVAGCMAWRGVPAEPPSLANPQDDLAEDVAGFHAFLRLGGFGERELRFDRHFEFHRRDRAVESLELLYPGYRVVADDRDTRARFGFGFDSVGKRHAPAGSQGIDATLEWVPAGERQYCVNAPGRERMGGGREVAMPPVHGRIGAHLLHERQTVLAGGGGQHLDAA